MLSTTFVALNAGVDETLMAIASTSLYLSVNVGGLVGTSLASNVLQGSLRTGLDAGLKDLPDRQAVRLGTLFRLRTRRISSQLINPSSSVDHGEGIIGSGVCQRIEWACKGCCDRCLRAQF